MFKYISDILSKFTSSQRILALLLLLFSIILITIGPNIISSLTYDNDELMVKVQRQKTEIQDLNGRVDELTKQVLSNQTECTNNLLAKEREVLDVLNQLERDATQLHTKTIRSESRTKLSYNPTYVTSNDSGPQVAASYAPIPDKVQTTSTQIDNSQLIAKIQKAKNKIQKDINNR